MLAAASLNFFSSIAFAVITKKFFSCAQKQRMLCFSNVITHLSKKKPILFPAKRKEKNWQKKNYKEIPNVSKKDLSPNNAAPVAIAMIARTLLSESSLR